MVVNVSCNLGAIGIRLKPQAGSTPPALVWTRGRLLETSA